MARQEALELELNSIGELSDERNEELQRLREGAKERENQKASRDSELEVMKNCFERLVATVSESEEKLRDQIEQAAREKEKLIGVNHQLQLDAINKENSEIKRRAAISEFNANKSWWQAKK